MILFLKHFQVFSSGSAAWTVTCCFVFLKVLENVSHSFFLCFKIEFVKSCSVDFDRESFNYFHAPVAQLIYFVRVVGEKSELSCTKISENLCSDVVFSQVTCETESQIGIESIQTFILKLVCLQLIDKSYASTFLSHVEENASSFHFDLLECSGQLVAAVTSQ